MKITIGPVTHESGRESSNIEAAAYDEHSRVLTIAFKNGSVYDYADVAPEAITEGLLKAESAGKWLNQSVKPSHAYRKVGEIAWTQPKVKSEA